MENEWRMDSLEPSTEQTGGAWYSNQEFDLEYIEIVSKYIIYTLQKEVCFEWSFWSCLQWIEWWNADWIDCRPRQWEWYQ